MKKYLIPRLALLTLVAAVMSLGLTACKKSDEQPANSEHPAKPDDAKKSEQPKKSEHPEHPK